MGRHESSLPVAGTSLGYLSLFGSSLSAPKICVILRGRGWLQGVKVKSSNIIFLPSIWTPCPLSMGTAWHVRPLPLPQSVDSFLPHPSGQKCLIQVVNEHTGSPYTGPLPATPYEAWRNLPDLTSTRVSIASPDVFRLSPVLVQETDSGVGGQAEKPAGLLGWALSRGVG